MLRIMTISLFLLISTSVLAEEPESVDVFIADVVSVKDKQDPNASFLQRRNAEPGLLANSIKKHANKQFSVTMDITGLKFSKRDKRGRDIYEVAFAPLNWPNADGVVISRKLTRIPLTKQQAESIKPGSKVTLVGTMWIGMNYPGSPEDDPLPVAIAAVKMPASGAGLSMLMLLASVEVN